ncbi:RNA polymerase sigma factor [Dinghuibacter silviterrae]|uniref:RNA polymerase sigma-70 factor (ECF subfamily) n=1 Tax=Dinghuibacter silviterrae TaxID=1539049 RepID=A0A4R8DR61_9BACT|nr:sigma-70 family RNA polymerase sigma factor [Dinghuibacter silviterrae]TDX00288.1 RNA polymerase sigma-70 factor (ECF subfamily) [Dinghuibacter silviterrae]
MNDCAPSESELLQKMVLGDRSAYAAIYQRYHAGIYHYILRFVKLPDLAEDLVHDVFLKIWEVRERIDPSGAFGGYLYRIARNHVYKTIQRIAADRVLRARVLRHLGEEPPLEWIGQNKEYERLFGQALSLLPQQRRNVFRLCREEGKTYEETAAILGISRNAVKKHMILSMRSIHDFMLRNGDVTLVLLLLAMVA